MFCKKCGHQNPDGAKFCMSCGSVMSTVAENTAVAPKPERIITASKVHKKPNALQKILLLISLVWLIVCFFYIPYNEEQGIVYDTLWSGRNSIVWLRLALQLGSLTIITYFFFRYLARFNQTNKAQFRKTARREFYVFLFFVGSQVLCGAYLYGTNFINRNRMEKIAEKIAPIERQIQETAEKRNARSQFWEINRWVFDLSQFDGKINRLWDGISLRKEDERWVKSYYNQLRYNYDSDLRYLLKINNLEDFKTFLNYGVLTEKDFATEREQGKLQESLDRLYDQKSKLKIYKAGEIRKITFIFLIAVFGVLYLIRPLFWFIKGLLFEINAN